MKGQRMVPDNLVTSPDTSRHDERLNPVAKQADSVITPLADLPRAEGGFGTVLIDPPWRYTQGLSTSAKTRGSAEKVYAVMDDDEIVALPIASLLAPNAQVWLWATNAHLHRAFHCLDAWGLEYKTMATWVKNRMGLGYWLRGQSEHLLLGIKGWPREKMTGPHGATGLSWSTLIEVDEVPLFDDPVRQHSQKPAGAYHMIEAVGMPPRLELFARQRRDGWIAWGNEV